MNCIEMNCIEMSCIEMNFIEMNCTEMNCIEMNCIEMNCIEMNCIEMNCIEMYCINRWLWRYMHYVELISSIWFIFVILVSKCILRWQPTFITFAVYSITRCSLVGESQTEPVFTWHSTIGTVAISVHYTSTTCVLCAARIPLRPHLPSWYLNTHTGTSCQLMISKNAYFHW